MEVKAITEIKKPMHRTMLLVRSFIKEVLSDL